MDKAERDLRKYMKKRRSEKRRGKLALVCLVVLAALFLLVLKLLGQIHIVFFFDF